MSETDSSTERLAVTRLYELVRNGDTNNCEFSQLDSMIYQRLLQTYASTESAHPQPVLRSRTAA